MPVNLYYTQKVRGFQQSHVEYFPGKAVYELKRTEHLCPRCGSKDVFAERMGERSIRGVPMGVCREVHRRHDVQRICRVILCGAMEEIEWNLRTECTFYLDFLWFRVYDNPFFPDNPAGSSGSSCSLPATELIPVKP